MLLRISGVFVVVPIAYDIIKYVGAAYLVYLGMRFILSLEEMLPRERNWT